MRLTGFLAFALLSISILSYGVSGSVFAANSFITVSTDLEIYGNGGTVVISGNIKNYDSNTGKGLTFLILSPDNNIVTIGQLVPNSDGSFEKSLVAGGQLWKLAGDYVVEFHYGANESEIIINRIPKNFPKFFHS